MLPITLYDMPGKNGQPWNPMPMRTRICLNFKGLPFKTEWLEYPDIKPILIKLGVAPSATLPDGSPFYTLPVISDPNNVTADGKPTIVGDSQAIAEYLDKQYPSEKALIPEDTKAFQTKFQEDFFKNVLAPGSPAILPSFLPALTEASEPYFRATREGFLGRKLEDVCPEGSKERQDVLETIHKGCSLTVSSLDKNAGPFVLGSVPSFADVVIASFSHMIIMFAPKDWDEMSKWDGGWWKAHYEACASWLENLNP